MFIVGAQSQVSEIGAGLFCGIGLGTRLNACFSSQPEPKMQGFKLGRTTGSLFQEEARAHVLFDACNFHVTICVVPYCY